MDRPTHPEVFTARDRDGNPTHVILSWDRESTQLLGLLGPALKDGRVLTSFGLRDGKPPRPARFMRRLGKQINHPEVFAVRDREGNPVSVVLSWDADAAQALGIDEPARKDGRILTTFELCEPEPELPAGGRL